MKRLEFHISYICNHACIFCSEAGRMRAFSKNPLTPLQVRAILIDRAKKGFNHVNFTGGEPTIFPNFLDLLRFAKKLGYRIYVGTNGTRFVDEKFTQEALSCIDELSLSIHWYNQETCFQQTKHQNHFSYISTIFENIQKYQQNNQFFANVVLNSVNYRDAEKIVRFIGDSRYPVQQILISNIAPEGDADVLFEKLVFDLSLFSKSIPSIQAYCKEKNITLRMFWFPTCVLGDSWKEISNDAHWEERHTIERCELKDGGVWLVDIYSPDNSRKRVFIEKCASCSLRENPCTGVFEKYLDYYTL